MAWALLLGGLLVLLAGWSRHALWAGLRLVARESWARVDLLLVAVLFGLALCVRLWQLDALGPTVAEPPLLAAARNCRALLLAGRFDALSWAWASGLPGLGAAWLLAPAAAIGDTAEAVRLGSAFCGALICGLLFLVAREGVGRGVGILAASLYLVLPPALAEDRLASGASPAALFYLLAIWLFFRATGKTAAVDLDEAGDRPAAADLLPNSGYFLAAGLSAGAAVAAEPSAITLVLALPALYLLVAAPALRREGALRLPPALALLPVCAVASFVAMQPPLWHLPFEQLGRLLVGSTQSARPEYLLGELTSARPGYYLPLYIGAALPVGFLFAVGLGIGRVVARHTLGGFAALLWFGAPLLVAFGAPSRGLAAIAPALVAACLLAAAGLDWLARALARLADNPLLRLPATAVGGAALTIYLLFCAAGVHPYYLDYYGELAGGVGEVARDRSFSVGWQGEASRAALRYVNRRAPRGASLRLELRHAALVAARADLRVVAVEELRPDFIVRGLHAAHGRRPAGRRPAGYRLVHTVRVDDVVLVRVFRRDK